MSNKLVTGSLIKVWLNGNIFSEIESISWNINYTEEPIYGIDSPHPQEIASNRVSVTGSVNGIRIKYSKGLQGKNAITPIIDLLKAPYISIRIEDRSTGETLLFIPEAKISDQAVQVPARGIVRTSFNFKGMVPYESLDYI